MAVGASKIFIFSTLALSAGGVTAGTLLFPNAKEEKSENLKTKSSSNLVKENELNAVSSTENADVPQKTKKKCTIYVTDESKSRAPSNPQVTTILSKHYNVEDFLKDKKNTDSVFSNQVEKACSGGASEKLIETEDTIYVYVYKKESAQKWIYSVHMQKDWISAGIKDSTLLPS